MRVFYRAVCTVNETEVTVEGVDLGQILLDVDREWDNATSIVVQAWRVDQAGREEKKS